jgi:hypothetical protein
VHEDLRGLSEAGYGPPEGIQNRKEGPIGLSEAVAGRKQSEGRRKLSWIWLTPGVELDDHGVKGDKGVHDGE